MRRVFAIAVTGLSLAGCSTFSLAPTPVPIQVQFESVPSGAEATTSLGPACKTPCSLAVPAPDAGFTVTFAMSKFQPVTIPVQVTRNPGDFTTPASIAIDPNPVVAELRPAGPPPRAVRKSVTPKKPKPPKAGAAPAAGSPFPTPTPTR